jgi:hypothetical protein
MANRLLINASEVLLVFSVLPALMFPWKRIDESESQNKNAGTSNHVSGGGIPSLD